MPSPGSRAGCRPGTSSWYEQLAALRTRFGFQDLTRPNRDRLQAWLAPLALRTADGLSVITALLEEMRRQRIIIPGVTVVEQLAAAAMEAADRIVIRGLSGDLTPDQAARLEALLSDKIHRRQSRLSWLREPPGSVRARGFHEVLDRLDLVRGIGLSGLNPPAEWAARLEQMAREGKRLTSQAFRQMTAARRRALLVATVRELEADLTDAALSMFDGFVGRAWRRAEKRGAERSAVLEQDGKERLGRLADALDAGAEAYSGGKDAHAALTAVQPWEELALSARQLRRLLKPEPPDLIADLDAEYAVFHRIGPRLLESFVFEGAAFVQPLLTAVDLLRGLSVHPRRPVPATAPATFVSRRWRRHVVGVDAFNRRFYELCVLFELRDRLRAGDIRVRGSRLYRSLDEFLAPPSVPVPLPPAVARLPAPPYPTAQLYLDERMALLDRRLRDTARMLEAGTADGVALEGGKLKLHRPGAEEMPEADRLADRLYRMVPQIRITDLLEEVNAWTDLAGHFGHVQTGRPPADRRAFLATLIAEANNLGLTRMAQVCPAATRRQLLWIATWHTREETYRTGLARLVEAQHREPMARWFGGGIGATSDGQHFHLGGAGEAAGEVNAHYGRDPAVKLYTHISDRYAPFHVTVIAATAGEAAHVLDGLLHHDSALDIREHRTDAGGVSDHVFALMTLLGLRFLPRIPNLDDRRLYAFEPKSRYGVLGPLMGDRLERRLIESHWDEVTRVITALRTGTVKAALILKKLAAYPKQNGLALALREIGRIERTLGALDWIGDPGRRRETTEELNKGESRNALARAVSFHRLGRFRDRSHESQLHRAAALNLVTAAIVLWNTRYLGRALNHLHLAGERFDEQVLRRLSPLGWEHINLTGDYVWSSDVTLDGDGLRPLILHP
jgi:TnpA family transposase